MAKVRIGIGVRPTIKHRASSGKKGSKKNESYPTASLLGWLVSARKPLGAWGPTNRSTRGSTKTI